MLDKSGRIVCSLVMGIHNEFKCWINEISDKPVLDKSDVTV